jgi:uncharacterized repeat protein (TIGR03806 family)
MRAAILAAALLAAAPPAAAVDDAAILAADPAPLLSQYGFFSDAATLTPAAGVVAYGIATPLFSDRALKFRAVYVPGGKTAAYSADEAFDFPVGSALIKTFAFPASFAAPDRDLRVIETRLLLRQAEGWKAHAYVWRDDRSDAELKIAGKRLDVAFLDEAGRRVAFQYAVPNRNQCKGCHDIGGQVAPIGPKARNLNFVWPPSGGESQIAAWTRLGILQGAPDPSRIPRAVDAFDPGNDVAGRARAWLDVNCAHCHRREGPASNSGLFLGAGETDPVSLGIGKRPVAAGRGAGDRSFDIVPGEPDRSILMLRVESAEPGVMMPELGRNLADDHGAALIRAWIASLR